MLKPALFLLACPSLIMLTSVGILTRHFLTKSLGWFPKTSVIPKSRDTNSADPAADAAVLQSPAAQTSAPEPPAAAPAPAAAAEEGVEQHIGETRDHTNIDRNSSNDIHLLKAPPAPPLPAFLSDAQTSGLNSSLLKNLPPVQIPDEEKDEYIVRNRPT